MGKLLDKLPQVYRLGNDFGVSGGYCMQYVRESMEALGFKTGKLDAWDSYVRAIGGDHIVQSPNTVKKNWSNSEMQSIIGRDRFCLVYGLYVSSKWKYKSSLLINRLENSERKYLLEQDVIPELAADGFTLNPITHVGVWTQNKFFNVVSAGLRDSPSSSFYFLAYFDLTNKMNAIDEYADRELV